MAIKATLANRLKRVKEIKAEIILVKGIVDGNKLNIGSQGMYSTVISKNDEKKASFRKKIEELEAIPADQRTDKQKATLLDVQEHLSIVMTFEKDLANLIEHQPIRIDLAEKITGPSGTATKGAAHIYRDKGKSITNEIVAEIETSSKSSHLAALGAHELRHLVQARRGKVAFSSDQKYPMPYFYDISDEVEAYRIQFVLDRTSIPNAPTKLSGITSTFVRSMGDEYKNLPEGPLGFDTKMEVLHQSYTHPTDSFKARFCDNFLVINPDTNKNQKAWDYYKDKSFRFFAKSTLYYEFQKKHGTFSGVKTNAEVLKVVLYE